MNKKIAYNMSLQEIITTMSEGNPGGLRVLIEVAKHPEGGFLSLLNLDDMGIRGPMVWVGYKDHCGQDLNKFVKAVNGRDRAMIATINEEPGMPRKAVAGGAS